ncbi:MAG: hypothetical protein D6683_14160 [Actinomyces sp.]|nr:MAG: hypothetical protein D6683_14160 [Actinomyces sp.]
MNRATLVFFRDDDVGAPCDAFDRFARLFVQREIPVAYAVVPAFLTPDTAEHVRTLAADHAPLVSFHQHGTEHRQELRGRPVWSEFAGRIPIERQRDIVGAGRERLTDLLGDAFDGEVFTPPAHKYTVDTVRVLDELGVRILSAGVHTGRVARLAYGVGHLLSTTSLAGRTVSWHGRCLPGGRVTEWSCAIDVDQDGRGHRVTRSAEELAALFRHLRRHLDVIGVMTHHECYTDEEKFTALAGFLDLLADEPDVRIVDIHELPTSATRSRRPGG